MGRPLMGPRGCVVCRRIYGLGRIEGCHRCRSTVGHAHVTVTGRDGVSRSVAVCDVHRGVVPDGTETASAALVPVAAGSGRKRAYDRARRKALARLRESHRVEFERLLAEEVGR